MKPGKTMDVVNGIRKKISSGEYQPGQRLPRIHELMVDYDAKSRSTISAALHELVADGLLDVRHGSGTFVRAREAVRRNLAENLRLEYRQAIDGNTADGLFETMTGINPDRVKVDPAIYKTVNASDRCAELLGVEVGSPLLERTYRYRVDGHPHQIARSYLTADMASRLGLTGPEVEEKGLGIVARLHNLGVNLTSATIEIAARRPTDTEAAELAIPTNAPVVEVGRILNADARPVELSNSVVRADDIRYFLTVELGQAAP